MPRYHSSAPKQRGHRDDYVAESNKDESESDDDDYMPSTFQKNKRVAERATPTKSRKEHSFSTIVEPKVEKVERLDELDKFIDKLQCPIERKMMKKLKPKISLYNCADRALEAIRALNARDASERFLRTQTRNVKKEKESTNHPS